MVTDHAYHHGVMDISPCLLADTQTFTVRLEVLRSLSPLSWSFLSRNLLHVYVKTSLSGFDSTGCPKFLRESTTYTESAKCQFLLLLSATKISTLIILTVLERPRLNAEC